MFAVLIHFRMFGLKGNRAMNIGVYAVVLCALTLHGAICVQDMPTSKKKISANELEVSNKDLQPSKPSHDIAKGIHESHNTDIHLLPRQAGVGKVNQLGPRISPKFASKRKDKKLNKFPNSYTGVKPKKGNRQQKRIPVRSPRIKPKKFGKTRKFQRTGRQLSKRGRNLQNIIRKALESRKRTLQNVRRKPKTMKVRKTKSNIAARQKKIQATLSKIQKKPFKGTKTQRKINSRKQPRTLLSALRFKGRKRKVNPSGFKQQVGRKSRTNTSKGKKTPQKVALKKRPWARMPSLNIKRKNLRGRLMNRIKSVIGALKRKRKGKQTRKLPTGYLRRLVGIPSKRFNGKTNLNKPDLSNVLRKGGVKTRGKVIDSRVIKKEPGRVTSELNKKNSDSKEVISVKSMRNTRINAETVDKNTQVTKKVAERFKTRPKLAKGKISRTEKIKSITTESQKSLKPKHISTGKQPANKTTKRMKGKQNRKNQSTVGKKRVKLNKPTVNKLKVKQGA